MPDPHRAPETVLTDRQREVATTAVELGYDDVPREATVADLAGELDIADSTVSAHHRKAESAVMNTVYTAQR